MRAMRLDVVLPTYNRAALLPRAIEAFVAARVPEGVSARLLVADNNSSDATRATVAACAERSGGRVGYLFEAKQGRHHALNAAIAATQGEILGFVDDDEVMEAGWIEVVARELGGKGSAEGGLDFIGGPYVPNWQAPCPAWLPDGFVGVTGAFEYGTTSFRYGTPECPTHLLGGNAAVRRVVFERVGPYSDRYPFAEDLEMYRRMLAAGFVGAYMPDMVIYHDIPARRLTKTYFRHWVYTAGRNDGKFARDGMEPVGGPRLLGVPRWKWRRAAEGLGMRIARLGRRDDPVGFAGELHAIALAGYLRGRWLTLPERHRDRSGRGPA